MAVTRIALFAVALTATFAGAFVLGGTVDPDAGDDSAHDAAESHDGIEAGEPARIVVEDRTLSPAGGELAFRVVDGDGATIRDFDVEHERAMHLIAVRRDLTGYRHLHPRQRSDGAWEVSVEAGQAGPHRLYADFSSGGEPYTLTADVAVAGEYRPQPLPAPSLAADAGEGYVVEVARDGSERRFTVTRDGRPVDDLEPYLGARGHLVAIREGSLDFLHVHPEDAATEGRAIRFAVTYRRGGPHRLFLQFRHRGEVHTAAFTETVTSAGEGDHEEGGAHGH